MGQVDEEREREKKKSHFTLDDLVVGKKKKLLKMSERIRGRMT